MRILLCLSYFIIILMQYTQSYVISETHNITVPLGNYTVLNYSAIPFGNAQESVDYISDATLSLSITLTNYYGNTEYDVFILNQTELACFYESFLAKSTIKRPCANIETEYLNDQTATLLRQTQTNITAINYMFNGNNQTSYIVIDNSQYPSFLASSKSIVGAFSDQDIGLTLQTMTTLNLSYVYYDIFQGVILGIAMLVFALLIFIVTMLFKFKAQLKKNKKLKSIIEE